MTVGSSAVALAHGHQLEGVLVGSGGSVAGVTGISVPVAHTPRSLDSVMHYEPSVGHSVLHNFLLLCVYPTHRAKCRFTNLNLKPNSEVQIHMCFGSS